MKLVYRLLSTFTAVAIIFTFSAAAYGLKPRLEEAKETFQANVEAKKQAAVDRLHQLGDRMVDQRITALNKAIIRVNQAARVSESERSAIVADLNTNINNLTALRATIDADTNVDSLKSEVKSITTTYRIYIVVLPRARGELAVGRANAVLGRLNALSDKIQRWIDAAKAKGADTGKVESLYQDFQNQLADARSQVDSSMNHFQSMQPAADTSAAKAHLSEGKAAMQKARQDLKAAQQILRQIIAGLKGLRLGTSSSTQTAR